MAYIDGEWCLAEFKTSNNKLFRPFDKNTLEHVRIEHFIQCHIYMHYTGVSRALYMVVNKDSDEIYTEFVNYSNDVASYYIDRAKRIITSPIPLERVNDDPSWYKCAMCEFRVICHGKDEFARNCRTCIHATPKTDAGDKVWFCEVHHKELTFQDQKQGCECYEPIKS